MVIVDSSIWIDYLAARENEHTVWLEGQVGYSNIGLVDLILMEVLQGLRDDRTFQRVRKQLAECEMFSSGGEQLAIAAAENYRYLRARGHTIRKTIDCLIATSCLTGGHSLLHRDRDFDAFEQYLGLQVVHPIRH